MPKTTRKVKKASLKSTRKRLGLNRSCPTGYKLRAPYTRKFSNTIKQSGYNVHKKGKIVHVYPKSGSALVKASCVKDRGSGKTIGPLKEGDLSRYGYKARSSEEARHKALKKAIEVYGALSTYRKLDAVAKLTVRTAPEAHVVFVEDRSWIQNNYVLKERA